MTVALLLAVPLSGVGLLGASLVDKYRAGEALDSAMDFAGDAQVSGRGLPYQKLQAEQAVNTAKILLEDAEQHKAQARRKLVEAQRAIVQLRREYGIDVTESGALLTRREEESRKVASFFRYLSQTRSVMLAAAGKDIGMALVQSLLTVSLGEITDRSIRLEVLERARLRVFTVVLRAQELGNSLPLLEREYAKELEAYRLAWEAYRDARNSVSAAEQRIAEVARITEEVQAQIMRLQRELVRIDAKLVAKIERELIEKGLMAPKPGERSDGRIRGTQTFRWPVVGRVSAGYLNAAYRAFFGVPHRGMDIVAPQGTPIVSAADGIVFLARDGGTFGYSYVLIGHRNGYATLYGHLSSIAVSTGQEVQGGQLVGSSGGTPGTYGAGPMTTGAHLHFEVILNGENVDPKTILP